MQYLRVKSSLINLDNIEGFSIPIGQHKLEEGGAIIDFWIGSSEQITTPELRELHKLSRGLLDLNEDYPLIHPGNLWEMCEIWKVPYPTKYMKIFETVNTETYRRSGLNCPRRKWERICEDIEDIDERNEKFFNYTTSVIKTSEEEDKTLEQALDELVPHIFAADKTELQHSRFRAVRDILLMEWKIREVYLDAFKLGVKHLTSSTCVD